ncbi:helicase RepA family protein, partial [Escherichia coli]
MKSAPNLKKQPYDKMTEVIIFAGSDAWAHAKQWQEQEGRLAGDNVPPVWLGEQQLAELADTKIIDEGRYCVRLYKAGHIRPSNINAIAQKLAAAGVQDANYYPDGMHSQKRENWREYLERERGEKQEEKGHQRKTKLPMSVGSAGYDTQLDYVVKGIIPAVSLCSIYGASGS